LRRFPLVAAFSICRTQRPARPPSMAGVLLISGVITLAVVDAEQV
jgi:hypothetical protein